MTRTTPLLLIHSLSGIGQSAFTLVELGSTVEESAWGVSCWIAFVSLPGALSEAATSARALSVATTVSAAKASAWLSG